MIVIFLGPPGAGKGTQCKFIVDTYGLKHLSSGDILRRERSEGTDLGKEAQGYMDSGKLVPDDLIVAMMMKEIAACGDLSGFVFDGFPRTIGQAKELDKAMAQAGKKIDVVLNLQVDDSLLEERVCGRRSCLKCGAAYHVKYMAPKVAEQCDNGCGKLSQRADDTAETVKNRIAAYHAQTAPLVEYYNEQGNVKSVNGNVAIDLVTTSLKSVLDEVKARIK
ncbi:MAG: adenylate kinase [Sedimentisphaerales bacterium]|nr:adenylate kinase [Sedimentisphaerales bacterium]MBN2843491.1 adenylate kinase [Sedimentisphaerales bacterium]